MPFPVWAGLDLLRGFLGAAGSRRLDVSRAYGHPHVVPKIRSILSKCYIKQPSPFTFVSCFETILFSEEMDRVFVCDCHEIERRFQFHVFVPLIPEATETLFASHACWHHSHRFQSDVPEKREVVWVDDFENVQQCYGHVLFGDSIILLQ